MSLKAIPTGDLERELAQRRKDEAERRKQLAAFAATLVMENIDALIAVTPHSRTSCSDTNVCNGIGSAEYGARCKRCLLLDAKEQGYWPENYSVEIGLPPVLYSEDLSQLEARA